MGVLILKMNWQFIARSERQIQRVISVHYLKTVNVSDEYIKHSNLITERLASLLYNDSDFAIFVECLDSLIFNQFDNWARGFFISK